MHKLFPSRSVLTILITFLGVASAMGALWWAAFALKPYEVSAQQLAARYAHAGAQAHGPSVELGPVELVTVGATSAWARSLRFASFDGAHALGRIVYPGDPAAAAPGPRPVLLALHGMGRTQWRWWQSEYKGRHTIEHTHLLAERALRTGHVVVALDARAHGDRKDPHNPVVPREMMRDLHWWGAREPYERMIVDTVKDYRVLLDWVVQQPDLAGNRVRAAGYSMGAQMALLLAAVDARVVSVAAMVPPHLDRKVAAVAPSSVASHLGDVEVWLLTANEDEYASPEDNAALFTALPGGQKRHLTFSGGHLLPLDYVGRLQAWLTSGVAAAEPTGMAAGSK